MTIQWFDVVGLLGVALTILAYLALQARRMKGDGLIYPLLNLIGAGAILASLVYDEHTNLSAFVIESAWCLISIYGIYMATREKASSLINKTPPNA
jgi:paired small multidrug resistance pump